MHLCSLIEVRILMISRESVKDLGTDALCEWLKTCLEDEEWQDAQLVIRQHKIKGKNFIAITEDKWMSVGLTLGVATSLVQVAQSKSFVAKQHKPNISMQIDLKPLVEGKYIDVSGLACAGLGAQQFDTKRLFLRNTCVRLLHELDNPDKKGLRVFGSPGIGKSCLVWAWACNEFVEKHKSVLWVHLKKDGFPLHILLANNQVFELVGADREYVMNSDADIVIVDGTEKEHKDYSQCLWFWKSNPNRISIQVASMQVNVNYEDDETDWVKKITVEPWTLDEYKLACKDGFFWNSVKHSFVGIDEDDTDQMVEQKFYYAGCSARWMFSYCIEKVKERITEHIDSCSNVIDLLRGIVCTKSSAGVNNLWVGYPAKIGGFRKFFVSEYVASIVLKSGGLEAVKLAYGIAAALNNPSFNGWIVEMDVMAQLQQSAGKQQVVVYDMNGNELKWDVPGIIELDLMKSIDDDLTAERIKCSFWMRPLKWNQGGYDIACLVKAADGTYMLRFVQVTTAHQHSLKLKYFQELTIMLVNDLQVVIPRIEITMLAPSLQSASLLRIPHGKVKNPGSLAQWICGEGSDKWKQGKEKEQVNVLWFESLK